MYQCIRLFNHLPQYIQSLSVKRFKRAVKVILLKRCYYTVNDVIDDSTIVEM